MGFLAPLLPALIPLGIQLLGKAVGGTDREELEYKNIQDPQEAAMRKKLLQMAMMQMGKPMGDYSSYGQGAASIFGMNPGLPDWWTQGTQMPGGMPGGTPGGNPWGAMNPGGNMPKRSLQAPPGGAPPGVPGGGNPGGLPVR